MTVTAPSRTSSMPRRGRDGIADRPLSDAGALIWSAHRPAVLSRHGVGGLLCLGVVPGPCAGLTISAGFRPGFALGTGIGLRSRPVGIGDKLGPILGGIAAHGLALLA